MMTLERQLATIGLSENQASVYLASLLLGSSTVLRISEKARIKRPTAYVAIEELMQLGLMSTFTKGKKRYFSAESPEKLLDLVMGEKQELTLKEKSLGELLPQLLSAFTITKTKPQVRFFEGKEGIEAIQRDIITTKPSLIYSFVPLDPAHQLFPPQANDHRQKILRLKGVKVKSIYTSRNGRVLPERQGPMVTKFVSPKEFPFSTEIVIYGDKVAFLALKDEILGVVIESRQIAETMRTVFHLAWSGREMKK